MPCYTTRILDGINSPFPLSILYNVICSHTPRECESDSSFRLKLNNRKVRGNELLEIEFIEISQSGKLLHLFKLCLIGIILI